jgi:hypothetical protein
MKTMFINTKWDAAIMGFLLGLDQQSSAKSKSSLQSWLDQRL